MRFFLSFRSVRGLALALALVALPSALPGALAAQGVRFRPVPGLRPRAVFVPRPVRVPRPPRPRRPRPALAYIPHSTFKVNQVIGDYDWAFLAKSKRLLTVSRTVARFNIAGNDIAYSFEHGGKLVMLFGDTISNNPRQPWGAYSPQPFVAYQAADPMASSTSMDPEAGLVLNFYQTTSGGPLFVTPPGVPMGADDVPNSGISLNGQIPTPRDTGFYLICTTNSNARAPQAQRHIANYSVLTCFDENTRQFTTGRTLSALNPALPTNDPRQGHFIINALRADPGGAPVVWLFGAGEYRASDIYLASVPTAAFWSGQLNGQPATQYYGGLLTTGGPNWVPQESQARPVVFDDPRGGQKPWPDDDPTVGNVSVIYSSAVGLWLMTFDGGRQHPGTAGIYFSYAPQPWGPWSPPRVIFRPAHDAGYGVFIHNQAFHPPGPAGPTIGRTGLNAAGGDYAPEMIERFTKLRGKTLSVYYTLSTWNPYTVVLMRSDFRRP